MLKSVLFYLVVFLSNIIQCITGFAGTVLAMPFSVMLVGFESAKPILNVLGIAASIGVLIKNYKNVDKHEFIKIVSIMGVGIIGGMFISPYITADPKLIHIVLGAVVIVFALYNAVLFFLKVEKEPNKILAILLLVAAGIVHGVFVCGGPLLVTYAAAKIKDKEKFRATLSAVWIVLNTVIMFSDIKQGYFTLKLLPMLAISIIMLVGAVFIGEKIAKKMNKNVFMILSYILMLYSGISLIVN